jgi:hypothetical protein
MEQS